MNKFILKVSQAVIFTAIFLTALMKSTSLVDAEELVISGNGSGSDSEVHVDTNTQTTVEQSNQANVVNDVNVAADTGQNSTSGNTNSNTTIDTGNITADTSIQNSVNTSNVSLDCCPNQADLNVNISGNGTNSQNSVDLNLSTDTKIYVNQDAYINNTINGDANTGLNSANDNTNSDVSITTGNINVSDEIKNVGVNNATVSAPQGGFDLGVKISGNGSNSNNSVSLSLSNNLKINVQNISDISNSSNWLLNTGGNDAFGNTGGSVSIVTGDINVNTKIENGPINTSFVNVSCCNNSNNPGGNPNDPGNPSGGPIQSSLPSSGSNGSSSDHQSSSSSGSNGSSAGSALAAAIEAAGQILPQTGSFWTILLTLASLMMFVLGLYLRQHPGRDPSLRYVYA